MICFICGVIEKTITSQQGFYLLVKLNSDIDTSTYYTSRVIVKISTIGSSYDYTRHLQGFTGKLVCFRGASLAQHCYKDENLDTFITDNIFVCNDISDITLVGNNIDIPFVTCAVFDCTIKDITENNFLHVTILSKNFYQNVLVKVSDEFFNSDLHLNVDNSVYTFYGSPILINKSKVAGYGRHGFVGELVRLK